MSDVSQTLTAPKFDAVIAYVPDEFIWCDWLHRQLDATPIPVALAGQRTRHGFSRPSVLRIFPDPRDPAQAGSPSIPECQHLIVVCSPQSARAAQFDEQIRAFKKADGEERIIVFIVDAEAGHFPEASESSGDWVPAWLRWRFTEKGTFRPAEPSEPLIIDARSGRLSLPEARAHLLAALLDVPRQEIRAFHDLVTPEAAATLAAPEAEIVQAGEPRPNRRGSPWLRVAAVLTFAAGAAFVWVKLRPAPAPTGQLASAESETSAGTAQASDSGRGNTAPAASLAPLPIAPASPEPVAPADPEPKFDATPVPMPTVITSVALPAPPEPTPLPIATPTPEPPRHATTLPAAAIAFEPSEGPQTPLRTAPQPLARPLQLTSTSAWRRLRDLGDTLLERGNRDAGMVALAQAAEIALKAADSSNADGEKIEIARMCFRVGALQKQYFTPKESQRTLAGGLHVLERMRQSERDADERAALMENLSQLLNGSRE